MNLSLADFKKQAKDLLLNDFGYSKSDVRIRYDSRGSAVFMYIKTASSNIKRLYEVLSKLAGVGSDSGVYRDYFHNWTNIVDKSGNPITYLFVSTEQ